MNTERGVGGFRKLKPREGFTYFPDGRISLEVGRLVYKGHEIYYVRYGDQNANEKGIFHRTGGGEGATNYLNNKLGDGSIIPTWGYFFVDGWFEAGIEGIKQSLVSYYPSKGKLSLRISALHFPTGELSFSEAWIRVREYSIDSYDGNKYRSWRQGEWGRFGPIMINIERLPLIFSLAGMSPVVSHDASLSSSNLDVVVFTTRLPDESSLRRIVDPKSDILEAYKEARLYTPELREATAKEKKIFESLLRSS